MATSAIPAAIAWLVSTFQAANTLGTADPPVRVLDGPEVTDLSEDRVLWVGVGDPEESFPLGATGSQTWAALGAQKKNEQLSIPCTVRAWNGDGDLAAARTAAYGVLGAVENIVRANADLGGTVLVTLNGVDNVQLRQRVGNRGAIADVAFSIDAKARI